MKVKELPPDDRPREKLLLRGPQSLSNAELIAILLRTGTKGKSVVTLAQEIIGKYKTLSEFASKSVAEMTKILGVGKDKAATLAAAFEIARRVSQDEKFSIGNKITSPEDIANIFIPLLRDEVKEKFIVVCLSSSNKVTKYEVISVGNLNSSIVHPREVFKVAVDNLAASIILIHNHPSGNIQPSKEDITITKKLVEAGEIFDIKVLDHLIISGNKFLSFVEKRLI
ncbi:MAG: JAB domain-containing protein [Ignavibacteria bacterium]|nr:MAG: JAB domain-containing protein [Ignavibacteria bacterium]